MKRREGKAEEEVEEKGGRKEKGKDKEERIAAEVEEEK